MAKSITLAYIFWLIGGWCGLHHLYLGRDRHAFVWWCLVAGYGGIGWFWEVFRIPRYVAEANFEETYQEMLKEKIKKYPKPPFSIVRFTGQIIFGNLLAWLAYSALPQDETIYGISLVWLSIVLVPIASAIGVHTVGNIGREEGPLTPALLGAFIPGVLYTLDNPRYYLSSVAAAILFRFRVGWNDKPPVKRSFCKRLAVLGACTLLYSSLWGSFLYFNMTLTNEHGETIKFRESVMNLLNSPMWREFQDSLRNLWLYYKLHGWNQLWDEIIKTLDPMGERNALNTMGLSGSSSQKDITKRWRDLSKIYHPDKFSDPKAKAEAQIKFMEIKEAYDKLSVINSRRKSRNSRSA